MANEHQLEILHQGVNPWNKWREDHPDAKIDLEDADLSHTNLSSANLKSAYLGRVNLSYSSLIRVDFNEADLTNASLQYANLLGAELANSNLNHAALTRASLFGTDLMGANLSEAHLHYANIGQVAIIASKEEHPPYNGGFGTNLSYTNFYRADLSFAQLSNAELEGANLSEVILGWTNIGNIDLQKVSGLETVRHIGPSTIGIDTLIRSRGNIPQIFLRGAGLSDTLITYARSLANTPIGYYTCFISYSSKDQDFAERLYADLQSKGIRCWYAPYDLKIGDKWRDRIEESIRLHDKLLLVLSHHSIESPRVEEEAVGAQDKEERYFRETGVERLVLFPI